MLPISVCIIANLESLKFLGQNPKICSDPVDVYHVGARRRKDANRPKLAVL